MTLSPLPIDAQLPEIVRAMRELKSLVLTATPGAGKTTRLPPELLQSVSGKILVLQPRRLAAVAACERVAMERGWKVGAEVGYQVRFESRVSSATRLIFMTDALLLRRLLDDPELNGVDLVVIDEFHERNLNQDLILGSLRELQELGSAIKILIMSATLETDNLLNFLPGSSHIEVPGMVFPLEIRHSQQPLRLRTDFEFFERATAAAESACGQTSGDVLMFLPGTGEIARVEEKLTERGLRRRILPLHGSLSLAHQQEVLKRGSSPRLILATNVAEASVTVPGVDFVIDTGVAKVMEMNPRSGFSSLELIRISLFNARQRAGRAAREKAGVCWRLWTEHEEVTQARELPPECRRVDLSQSLLWLANFGVSDFANFSWFEAPPAHLLNVCTRSLRETGALSADNHLTDFGRKLLRYPLPPRWGALLAKSEELGAGRLGARVAAMLNERDFADGAAANAGQECDIEHRLALLQDVLNGRRPGGVRLRQAETILQSARQLEDLVSKGPGEVELRRLLLLSQKDRLCRRRAGAERGVMVGGRGVRLNPQSQVRESEFFLALQGVDLPGQPDTMVSMACGLSKPFVLSTLKNEIETVEEIDFIEEKSQFFSKRVRKFRDLALDEPVLSPVDARQVQERMAENMIKKWNWIVSQNKKLGAWMERWRFLRQHAGDAVGEISDEEIVEIVKLAAFGKTKVSEVVEADWISYLEMVLPKESVRVLRDQVPEMFAAPSGFSHRIHYGEGHSAYVEVRLQEIFGLLESPKVVFGKIPLTFRLLSPAYRPVQVTSDLAGFWRSGYKEVRKELRARYPKHSWPEDPYSAKPEAKGRRR